VALANEYARPIVAHCGCICHCPLSLHLATFDSRRWIVSRWPVNLFINSSNRIEGARFGIPSRFIRTNAIALAVVDSLNWIRFVSIRLYKIIVRNVFCLIGKFVCLVRRPGFLRLLIFQRSRAGKLFELSVQVASRPINLTNGETTFKWGYMVA